MSSALGTLAVVIWAIGLSAIAISVTSNFRHQDIVKEIGRLCTYFRRK